MNTAFMTDPIYVPSPSSIPIAFLSPRARPSPPRAFPSTLPADPAASAATSAPCPASHSPFRPHTFSGVFINFKFAVRTKVKPSQVNGSYMGSNKVNLWPPRSLLLLNHVISMSYLRDQRAGGDWRDVYLVLHLNIVGHRPGDIHSHYPLFPIPKK